MIKDRKYIILSIVALLFCTISSYGQKEEWKYNSFYNSFFKPEFKYSHGPTLTYLQGDLGIPKLGAGYGVSLESKILPTVELSTGIRYFSLNGIDHSPERQLSFCGKYFHYNALGRYFFIYDKIKTSEGIKKPSQKVTAYVTTGISLMYFSANPSRYGFKYSTNSMQVNRLAVNFPIGFGLSIKLSENTSIIPEALYYATSTDLLDGIISDSELSDHYGLFNIRFEHKLKNLTSGIIRIRKSWKEKRLSKKVLNTEGDEIIGE